MEQFNLILRNIAALILFVAWIAGVVLAKGGWLTALSIFLPFYAWYLFVERLMMLAGILP